MTPQKTKLQIIEELFDNYYVKDPSKRAVFGRVCLYYEGNTGNKCAVGMCMLNDDTAKYHQEFYQIFCSTKFVGYQLGSNLRLLSLLNLLSELILAPKNQH